MTGQRGGFYELLMVRLSATTRRPGKLTKESDLIHICISWEVQPTARIMAGKKAISTYTDGTA